MQYAYVNIGMIHVWMDVIVFHTVLHVMHGNTYYSLTLFTTYRAYCLLYKCAESNESGYATVNFGNIQPCGC